MNPSFAGGSIKWQGKQVWRFKKTSVVCNQGLTLAILLTQERKLKFDDMVSEWHATVLLCSKCMWVCSNFNIEFICDTGPMLWKRWGQAWYQPDLFMTFETHRKNCWVCHCSISCHRLCVFYLTHWGQVMHICIGNVTIIGSDNGLSPGQHQAIVWTNAAILSISLKLCLKFINFHTIKCNVNVVCEMAAILSWPESVNL